MQNFNEKMIHAILSQDSNKKNMISNMIKLLSICKESAYRRIKNQIPFSLEEVVILANHYSLSIDSLFDIKMNKDFTVDDSLDAGQDPQGSYSSQLRNDIGLMQKLQTSSQLKITAILNQIPFRLLPYQSLFKLDYCHELYSAGEISLMSKYSDIKISPELNALHNQAVESFSRMNHISCIIDGTIYFNIINKIKHYYRLGFMTEEDLTGFQGDLVEMLNRYESLLRTGANGSGSIYNFYYSPFTHESNFIFISYDGKFILQDYAYPRRAVAVTNSMQINAFRERIDSKIRNAVPITKMADAQQIDMLRAAYRQIEGLKTL